MTGPEWVKKQKDRLKELASGKALEVAALDTHTIMADRIFNQGKAADGSEIGKYNATDPIYVNPRNSPRKFGGQGKDGDTRKKNGSSYKTKFFKSYQDFRAAIGRETAHVNLDLSGMLRSDFIAGLRKKSANEWIVSLKRKNNSNKAAGAETHFGKRIFALTKSERENFVEVMKEYTQQVLNA